MKPQYSCCACNGSASFTKQHPLCIYGNRKASKTYLFFNKINKNLNKFTYDDLKLVDKISKEYEDEIDENIDSEKSTVTPSEMSCNGNMKDRPGNLFSLTCSCNTLTKSAADLSAQIMNGSFENYDNYMSQHDLAPRENISKLSPFDIIEKMKEVYKACSCKVCECIVGKSQQNEVCRCKPCECDDCNNFKKKITSANTFRSVDVTQAGADTPNVDRSLFKEFAKQQLNEDCNCKPCQCPECAKNAFAPYNSEQCHCAESKAHSYSYNKYQNLGVAPIKINNQSRRGYMCKSCNSTQCYEMSTGINRPLGCHCEICLNGTCLSDGPDTCSYGRYHRLMRKPTQRDTDYDIHRSIVTQQNIRHIDRGRIDLVAMIAAISKVYPDYHSQVNECSCKLCECLYCHNQENSANSLKTSNLIFDNNLTKHDDVKTLPLDHEFASKKTSLNITKATPCLNNLKRQPEIKTMSKHLPNGKCCRCSPCECIECDLVMTKGTDDVCVCERCTSKDDFINSIKKEEKRTAGIFDTKIKTSSFCNKKNQNDDEYETPQKKARSSLSLKEHYKTNLSKNDLVEEVSHTEYPNVEQQLCQKLTTKLKKNHHVEPFTDCTNTTMPMPVNGPVKFQSSHSYLIADLPISSHIGSESNSQSDNKFRTNSFGKSDSKYSIQYPKKNTTYLNGINELDKFCNNTHKKLNNISTNTTDHLNVSSNFHNRYANKLLGKRVTSSRFTKDNERKPNKLRYDKCCFVENNYFQSTNEYSECYIIGGKNSSDSLDITQTMKQNKVLASNMKEDYTRAVNISESTEKSPKNINETHSDELDNVPNLTTRKKNDLDEDYERVQNTIKDARTFSLHLKKLLETYEKANRDFENVFYNLPHSNQTLQQVVHISENVLREAKEALITADYSENIIKTENYSDNATTKYSFDNVPTKESNALFCNGKAIEKRLDIHVESIQPSKSKHDMNMVRNYEEKTVFIRNSSKTIVTKHLEKVDDKGYIEPKQKELSNESVCNSSCNDDTITEFIQDPLNTFSSSNVDDSSYHEENLLPTFETTAPTSILLHSVKTRKIKKQSKRYTKIVSNRRKVFVPKFAKCSVTNETSNDLIDQINENDEEINKLRADKSKLLKTDTESVVDKSTPAESDDSTTTIKTTGITNNLKFSRMLHQDTTELTDDDVIMIKPPLETEVHTCESLKVSSLTVRKVSDRTILVKWQVPKVLENVYGYELLVNGRSMQKIEDNLCCESVVSSLPRAEKILLTVRSMTKGPCCSHSPSTTVVYKPMQSNMKNSG